MNYNNFHKFRRPKECIREDKLLLRLLNRKERKLETLNTLHYNLPFYSSSLYGYSSGTCLRSLTCNSNASSPRSISRSHVTSVFIDTWRIEEWWKRHTRKQINFWTRTTISRSPQAITISNRLERNGNERH